MTEPEKNKDFDEHKPSTTSSNENVKAENHEKKGQETKPVFDVRKELPGASRPTHDESQSGSIRIFLIILLVMVGLWYFMRVNNPSAPITYGFFLEQLDNDNIAKVVVNGNKVSGEFRVAPPQPKAKSDEKSSVVPLSPSVKNETGKKPEENAAELPSAKDAANPQSLENLSAGANSANVNPENVLQHDDAQNSGDVQNTPNSENVDGAVANGNSNGNSVDASTGSRSDAENSAERTAENHQIENNAVTALPVAQLSAPTQESASTPVPANTQAETQSGSSSSARTQTTRERNDANASETKRLPIRFTTMFPSLLEAGSELDQKIRRQVGREFKVEESLDTVGYIMLLSIVVTIILVGSIWMQIRRTRDQLGGGQMFGFSKSPARRFQGGEDVVTFADVAGLKSVKEDLSEIVDFLKNPKKFERLGARIPKGVLMCGPPGTGKTLLARAIAGEATAAFYSINASEFIQLFVGVGASRVRDMFDIARNNAPSILFIDEIDAIGRQRGTGTGGGNDEREQTLNQILSEMDGFSTTESVIVIAATNRPDVLDPALLRPGRFDRHVTVDRPVHKDRIQLFKVHTKKVPLNNDVDFEPLASMTTGLTGADIRNIVNEAALWACRHERENVRMSDFYYSIDKVLMGTKREEVISPEEKEKTSYHEAGHTLVAWLTPDCDRVNKVSVIPRGRALGVTMSMPQEDRLMFSQREICAKLKMMLGGREAEKLVFNELNAGAANDLERATGIAQKMVAAWGMSPRIGPAAFYTADEHPFLGREKSFFRNFSEKTSQIIDEEVIRILDDVSRQVESLLTENRNKLDALAQALVIREELDEAQIEEILGPPAQRKFQTNK